ncbi:MAG TPA: MarR family winged helix-turn-helix transcriptional regulator [Marmoricola sp.]|nr:MarR family winged helix-turn-helix transcriptional regulator [Marmoricola sp.]
MGNEEREAAEHLFGSIVTMQRSLRSLTRTWAHDEAPLSRTELALLTTIAETGESRLGTVAACLGVTASVASRQVAALQSAGLIVRRPDPEDRRAELVALSDTGLARLVEIRDLGVARLAALLEGWAPGRLHLAGDLLGELASALAPPPDGHAPSPDPNRHHQEAVPTA